MSGAGVVDIVIVGYNQDHLTRRCFQSIVDNTPAGTYRVIYVDNGSHRGPIERLLRDYPQVEAVLLPANTGFPHGANVGLAHSLISPGEYVVLLNNDAWVCEGDRDWLSDWQAPLDHASWVGAVGAVTDHVYGWQRRAGPSSSACIDVPALIFFAVMLRKAAVRKVGLLDERYSPGNYEDFDYSLRLKAAGWRLRVAEGVWLHHDMHASHAVDEFGEVLERNKKKLIDKWGGDVAQSVGVA